MRPLLVTLPSIEILNNAMEFAINKVSGGNERAFSRFLGISREAVSPAKHKWVLYTFDTLLRASFMLGISALDLLIELGDSNLPFRETVPWSTIKPSPSPKEQNRVKVREMLHSALSEEPPPSLSDLAGRVGYNTVTSLTRTHSDLSRKLQQRYAATAHANRKVSTRNQSKIENKAIEKALRRALATEVPPSIEEVSRELGHANGKCIRSRFPELCSALKRKRECYYLTSKRKIKIKLKKILLRKIPISLKQTYTLLGYKSEIMIMKYEPTLCKRISTRYAEYRKGNLRFEAFLLEALKESPPPCLLEVSRRLNCSVKTLYRRFRDLCHQITSRFKAFRRKATIVKRQQLRKEIQRVISELKWKGLTLTTERIISYLRFPAGVNYVELGQMIKEIRTY